MTYFFAFILIAWVLIYFLFLRNSPGTLDEMRAVQQEMVTATDIDVKRAAARRVLAIIDRDDLTGAVVEEARQLAEAVLVRA